MTQRGRYPKDVRERAVRLVLEHQGEYPTPRKAAGCGWPLTRQRTHGDIARTKPFPLHPVPWHRQGESRVPIVVDSKGRRIPKAYVMVEPAALAVT